MEDLDNKGGKPKRRTLDLSLTQVASSALAAVVGAVLASQLGVYGTFLGAAVVSIGATTGTAVFQHVFRRTGEQFREMATTPTPVEHAHRADAPAEAEKAQVFDPFDPGGEHTRMMARINPPEQGEAVGVYRGRTSLKPKSWKVYAVTATIVFVVAMATVGIIEQASGTPASQFFGGGGGGGTPDTGTSAPADPSSGASTEHSGGSGGKNGGASTEPSSPSTSPSPHPSGSAGPTPDPAPPTPSPQGSTGSGDSGSGSSGSNSGTGNSGSGGADSGKGTSGDAATPQGAPSP
ncbi:hypothetical protein [Streptacidiphilus jiangxiensis]|uniref:Uncharacterized protein n=1 Tax=Streptacidiphilus jiangxiensis TaxID=235985 RepID=A0A1H7KSV1_STRJI|nr:hypothetical protein [Streptacidiphilus jiangxiensis]SEK89879.1 hypothetical protein SAMN05414137_104188 [Streptacidiphilus jiangxiensis]